VGPIAAGSAELASARGISATTVTLWRWWAMTSDNYRPDPALGPHWWIAYLLGTGATLAAAYLWVVVA